MESNFSLPSGPVRAGVSGRSLLVLVVATVLTLLALPAMYAAWFRVKREDPVTPAKAGAQGVLRPA